ncbi:ketosynthase [Streptomyces sp. NPDC090108]|uniref:ketosynthase n=1 Tax=Streptomyces sp. NPDC090108 TaxID=3365947 RepID=UPI003826BB71
MPSGLVSHRAIVDAACLTPWGDEASGLPGAAPEELPRIVGFAISRFGPLVHAVATACLGPADAPDNHVGRYGAETAIVLATVYGDAVTVDTATRRTVAGEPPNPLLFFQSVSTSILSHLTRRYGIHGPLTCISAVSDPAGEALRVADALLHDPELRQVLVIGVETKPNERVRRSGELASAAGRGPRLPAGDAAAALLLRRLESDTGAARLTLAETPPGTASRDSGEPAGPLGWLSNFMELCAAAHTGRHEAHTYELSP